MVKSLKIKKKYKGKTKDESNLDTEPEILALKTYTSAQSHIQNKTMAMGND